MRVIGGEFKGRRLLSPRTLRVRPTSDRVRENLFNIIQNCDELNVLDLFAGVGTVGIEALSRGARQAVFVDASSQSIAYIKKNTAFCHSQVQIVPSKVERAISVLEKKKRKFDLIFIDPPFEQGYVKKTLELLNKKSILNEGCQIVVQHSAKEILDDKEYLFEKIDQRIYGISCLTFLN